MKIEQNSVVSMHYSLKDERGELVDSSEGQEPLRFLAGANNIVPGLENALYGLEAGDKKDVVVEPDEGYGAYDEALVQKLPREMFGGIDDIEVGMSFQAPAENGAVHFVEVTKVEDDGITVDGNHLLAGKTLYFSVSIEEVREASESEIAHGHVH
ncbi:FKBP-type peptidyl-prolyl cis-trans isomerase [Agaribacterium haliotis]|uniref:FKBP-type peptidyl-prolyl cis-trans isomerase n=1 Tax=Agaribacterium haliotis TaxID=2013869 RepID=UPI000BB56700|nr:peptidylprolyl isomerase [Agaribacterium haliotis]